MEPLSTMLLAAISAAAAALLGGAGESLGGAGLQHVHTKLRAWKQLDEQSQHYAALDKAIQKVLRRFRDEYTASFSAEQALTLLDEPSPEGHAICQALAEELLFRLQPDRGHLADVYRRQLAFRQVLQGQERVPWASVEPAFLQLLGLIEHEISQRKELRSLVLERAELQALEAAWTTAQAARTSAESVQRLERLVQELIQLPRISVSISAADGAQINNAPVTIGMGNASHYTIVPIPPVDLNRLYQRYCAFIRSSFGTLDFRGIVQMQNVVKLRLEDIYVPLDASLSPHHRLTVHDEQRVPRGMSDDTSLHQQVRDHPFLVVLGDPGAGKSTLVRMIMLNLAEGKAAITFGLRDEWLPIFFPVAAFAEVRGDPGSRDKPPLDYLREYYLGRQQPDYTPLFERALLAGRALLLFDGLDEMRDNRLEITRCLEDFIHAWDAPGNRFVATSRIAGYEDAPLDDSCFVRTTIQPFSDAAIRLFAGHWSMAFERAGMPQIDPSDPELRQRATARTHELSTAIFAEPNVTELARNPLLLTILALIHNQGTRLPDRRVDLYQLCVQALAETWNRARALHGKAIDVHLGDEKLDEHFVINVLGPAALWVHTENPGGIVEKRDLERTLSEILQKTDGLQARKANELAADFLQLVNRETGLLQERGHQRYSFLHLTFEEYLAARALVDSATVDNADADIHQRATDPGWREVLRLALASVTQKEAQRLLLHLLNAPTEPETKGRPTVLAGECLRDIGRNRATHAAWHAVITALLQTIADPTVPVAIRVEAGQLLGHLGDPRLLNPETGKAIGEGDYDAVEHYWCAIEAGPFWSGDDRNEQLQQVAIRQPYRIARFPVTNAEYAQFMAAGGYDMRQPWWTDNGRARIGKRRQPYAWDDLRYNQPAQPVVGVTWYEAAAYCSWLTRLGHTQDWLPPDHIMRLSTWHEWERAARHTDRRRHPWGNEAPTPERANYAETGIGAPSSVGCFPAGAAVCGAQDLLGNVLEWTASPWQQWDGWEKDFTANEGFVLGWNDFTDGKEHLCCGARYGGNPLGRSNSLGFRVLQSLAPKEG